MNTSKTDIKIIKKRLIVVAAILLIFLLIKNLFPSEETKIKQLLGELSDWASYSKEYHPLEKLRIAKIISNSFLNPVYLKINLKDNVKEKNLSSENLIKELILASSYITWVKINVKVISLQIIKDQADVKLKLSAEGRAKNEEDKFHEELEVFLKLKKSDGEWLIESGENISIPEELRE